MEWVAGGHAATAGQSHQVANILIEVSGDAAVSEAYVTAAQRRDTDGRLYQTTIRGRYLDRWSRRDGRWAIDARRYVHDFADVRELTDAGMPASGAKDRSDPAYTLWPG